MASTLLNNLVAYYQMEGNANDSTGTNNATNINCTFSTGTGKILQGAGMGGTNAYIKPPDTAIGGTSMTVAFWARPSSLSSQWVLYSESANVFAGVELRTNGGITLDNATSTQSYSQFNSASTGLITNGVWALVVYMYNASTGFLSGYVNNVQVVNVSRGGNQIYGGLGSNNFGNYNNGSGSTFPGALDEIGIWSRALTGTELTELYNGGAGTTYPFATGNTSSNFFMMM